MGLRWRVPMFVIALVLSAVMALLALLQYRWLGQISEAERARMRNVLSAGASEFATDFDRELTRAYLLFQAEPGTEDEIARKLADRYDQWHATARFPRLLKELYVFTPDLSGTPLRRYVPAERKLQPSDWPSSMAGWEQHFAEREMSHSDLSTGTVVITRMTHPVWDSVPAIVSPMPAPLFLLNDRPEGVPRLPRFFSYVIAALDRAYIENELLPALVERHFRAGESGRDFHAAVIARTDAGELVYSSSPSFTPSASTDTDVSADLFQVRTQDFATMVAEVRRFMTFTTTVHQMAFAPDAQGRGGSPPHRRQLALTDGRPVSVFLHPNGGPIGGAAAGPRSVRVTGIAPRWTLVLKHEAGSLEAAVGRLRRRNVLISSSILAVLAASMALLVLSTRRAQRLARQQMEFVAAVSHELRTPLAVIRSAADNLADGVIGEREQVRKYGELMQAEGRRLSGMVEQILELAGIQSGGRGFSLRAVAIGPLLHEILSSYAALAERAGMQMELEVSEDLPSVLGDEPALRRVFENLVGNALKYGAPGRWVGVGAVRDGAFVRITVADRGMGIAAAEQPRIFEPFYRASEAVSAQIQGAGLGLSLVQRIVEAHGGRVSVKSAPGQGSEFRVVLQAAAEVPVRHSLDATQPASS